MKIMFINGSERKGGAAIAACRLRYALSKNADIKTMAVVAYKQTSDPTVIRSRTTLQATFENIVDRITNKVGLQYQFFPFSAATILKEVRQFKPDIINIHNTHGGYFPTRLLVSLSRYSPVVWTLHDMWSFTGNAAHTFGNALWKEMKHPATLNKVPPEIGMNLGEFLLRQKKRIYANSRLSIVTPSKWLMNLAQESPVFADKSIRHIFNGVDLSVFKPHPKMEIRQKMAISNESPVLVFSADFLKGNVWKGGNDLIQILSQLNITAQEKIHLVILGAGEMEELYGLSNFTVHSVGYVEGEERMADYLAAADLLIYPTRADNLPNVLIEAIACGLPCVTFDIGGCEEIIIDGVNGRIVPPSDFSGMAKAIQEVLDDKEKQKSMAAKAREIAEERFSINKMAYEYTALFQEISGE